MGGRIWAVNNPNDGSTFAFTVTLRTALTAIEGTMTDPLKELGLARRDVQDKTVPVRAMRILLAEDFLESQDIIRLYLRDTLHQLDCAASGLDAVTMFEKNMWRLSKMFAISGYSSANFGLSSPVIGINVHSIGGCSRYPWPQ